MVKVATHGDIERKF